MTMRYTFQELTKLAKSFLDRLPGATLDSVDNGWKMFAIAYLNTDFSETERLSAGPALYRIVWREYFSVIN